MWTSVVWCLVAGAQLAVPKMGVQQAWGTVHKLISCAYSMARQVKNCTDVDVLLCWTSIVCCTVPQWCVGSVRLKSWSFYSIALYQNVQPQLEQTRLHSEGNLTENGLSADTFQIYLNKIWKEEKQGGNISLNMSRLVTPRKRDWGYLHSEHRCLSQHYQPRRSGLWSKVQLKVTVWWWNAQPPPAAAEGTVTDNPGGHFTLI